MKLSGWKIVLFLVLLLVIPWTLRAEGLLPLGQAQFDFLYDRLDRADVLTPDSADYQLGPYRLSLAGEELGPFQWLADLETNELRLWGNAGTELRGARYASPRGLESFRGGIAARPRPFLFVYGSFRLDEALAEDPGYTGKKWRGLAGGVANAFVHVQAGNFSVMLGRFASFWGPRRSLVLASDVTMDGLGYAYRWGRLVLSYRLAKLDGVDPDDGEAAQFENRFFAGHRLDVHLGRGLRVGVFETAIFGGAGRQVELSYLNPILFYHASQLNDGVDDNTFLGCDFAWEPGGKVQLYGQLLVDDFQIDDKTQGDQEPNELGLLAGVYAVDVLRGFDVRGEYTRVTKRTFNQSHPRNRYTYDGALIGAAEGNDYDLGGVEITKWLSREIRSGVVLSHRRQGEGRVDGEWDTPWLEVEGEYEEPFPTGRVESTTTGGMRVTGFLFGHAFVDATAGIDWVRNAGHVDGRDETRPFFRVMISTFLSAPLRID